MSFQKQSFNNKDSFISTIFFFCLSWLNHPPQVVICIFPPFPPPFLRPRDATPHQTWFQQSQWLTAGRELLRKEIKSLSLRSVACHSYSKVQYPRRLTIIAPIFNTKIFKNCPFCCACSSGSARYCQKIPAPTLRPPQRPTSHSKLWITSLI